MDPFLHFFYQRHLVYQLDLLPSIAQLIDPRKARRANYVLPAVGLLHPPLLTKLLDIVFNVLRCNEHHPKEQFMKIWVNDCEGGLILLELLKLSSNQSPSDTQQRLLENHKMMIPRPLHLRFNLDDATSSHSSTSSNATTALLSTHNLSLGSSVKKRVETILENFFEFGTENDGFGPFFSERHPGAHGGRGHNGNRHNPLRGEGYGSDEDLEDDLDEDDYHTKGGHYDKDAYYESSKSASHDVDFDIDDMEERVGKMNLT